MQDIPFQAAKSSTGIASDVSYIKNDSKYLNIRDYNTLFSAVQIQIQPPAGQGQTHWSQERHRRPPPPALPAGRPPGQRSGVPQRRADDKRPVPPHPGYDPPGGGEERPNAGQRSGLPEEAARVHGATRRHEGQVGQEGV